MKNFSISLLLLLFVLSVHFVKAQFSSLRIEEFYSGGTWDERDIRIYSEYTSDKKLTLETSIFSNDNWVTVDTLSKIVIDYEDDLKSSYKIYNKNNNGVSITLHKETVYYYTGSRLDSNYTTTYTGSGSSLSRKELFNYNANQQKVEEIISIYSSGEWFSSKIEYTYNANDSIASTLEYSEAEDSWEIEGKNEYYYNNLNQKDSVVEFVSDNSGGFDPTNITEYNYLIDGRLSSIFRYILVSDEPYRDSYNSITYENEFIKRRDFYNYAIDVWVKTKIFHYTFTDLTTSLQNTTYSDIMINNPVSDKLTIMGDTQDYDYVIFTMKGEKIMEGESNIIDVSDLAPGAYLININATSSKRFVKY